MQADLLKEPLGRDADGIDVYLRDIWASTAEVRAVVDACVEAQMFTRGYADVRSGDENWRGMQVPDSGTFDWSDTSTYVRHPPYFDAMPREPRALRDIVGARVLAFLADSATTDHISPAGAIKADSPAGRHLSEHGVASGDFNSYGSRRGNYDVMIRGTFANVRLRKPARPRRRRRIHALPARLRTADDLRCGNVLCGQRRTADRARRLGLRIGILAGLGRQGTMLLGVKAVIATSFERIHRSNLIGMGVLPLQFRRDESAEQLGLTGEEAYSVVGLEGVDSLPDELTLRVEAEGAFRDLTVIVRIDTPAEAAYFQHGASCPRCFARCSEADLYGDPRSAQLHEGARRRGDLVMPATARVTWSPSEGRSTLEPPCGPPGAGRLLKE